MKGHTNAVSSAIFSPRGKRIATASWDGTARVWRDAKAEQNKMAIGALASAQIERLGATSPASLVVTDVNLAQYIAGFCLADYFGE